MLHHLKTASTSIRSMKIAQNKQHGENKKPFFIGLSATAEKKLMIMLMCCVHVSINLLFPVELLLPLLFGGSVQ